MLKRFFASEEDRPLRGRPAALAGKAEMLAELFGQLLMDSNALAQRFSGLHPWRRAGAGERFWQYREYTAGDAVKSIDWRRSARSPKIYVREFERDVPSPVWFWVDTSFSMHFKSRGVKHSKVYRASLLMLTMLNLAVWAHEGVGYLTRERRMIRSREDIILLARFLLSGKQPQGVPQKVPLTPFSQVILFTDGFTDINALDAQLAFYGAQAAVRGHLVIVNDPVEHAFPFSGRTRFVDTESEDLQDIGAPELVREHYMAQLERHGDALAELAARHRFELYLHTTNDNPVDFMARLLAVAGSA